MADAAVRRDKSYIPNISRVWSKESDLFDLLDDYMEGLESSREVQACLRPRDRFLDIPAPKIDSAFDNLLVPQPSWSPNTTQQLRRLVAAPYLSPNDWTPRLDAYFASPLALCARRVSSAASRRLGTTNLRIALHGWQRKSDDLIEVLAVIHKRQHLEAEGIPRGQ